MTSTHRVEVVPVELLPHPNADSLSIVKVWGYQCVVKTADWAGKSVGAYIPPDSVCPDTPEFEFLGKRKRIRAVKLRGQLSMGLLMPAPDGAKVGDDVAEVLGVTHYEPPIKGSKNGQEAGSEAEIAPPEIAHLPKYDIDSLRRYTDVFSQNEVVWITEKIHGASSKFAYRDDRMWCGSRTEWKKQDKNNIWWRVLEATPEIELFCRAHPDHVLYGEVYGQVQDLRYGVDQGVRFVAFDVRMCAGPFVDPEPARDMLLDCEVPMVPMITVAPFNLDKVIAMAEGPSILARQNGVDQVREGCVVKPLQERSRGLGSDTTIEHEAVEMKYIPRSTFPRQSTNMIHIRCVGGSKHGKWTDIPEDYLRRRQFSVAVPERIPVTDFYDPVGAFTEEIYRIEPVACYNPDVIAYIAIIDGMTFEEASNHLMWLAVTEELR